MSEKEVIEQIKEILKSRELHKEIIKCAGGSCVNCKPDILALEGVLQLLEQKDTRIDKLEKALIEEQLKHTDKINKVMDKLKEVKKDFLDFCPDCVDLAEELLDILEGKAC